MRSVRAALGSRESSTGLGSFGEERRLGCLSRGGWRVHSGRYSPNRVILNGAYSLELFSVGAGQSGSIRSWNVVCFLTI
jgi:hypothetical protein